MWLKRCDIERKRWNRVPRSLIFRQKGQVGLGEIFSVSILKMHNKCFFSAFFEGGKVLGFRVSGGDQ